MGGRKAGQELSNWKLKRYSKPVLWRIWVQGRTETLHKMNHEAGNFPGDTEFSFFLKSWFFKWMNFLLIEIYEYFLTKLITLKWFKYSWLLNNKRLIHKWASLVGKSQPLHLEFFCIRRSQPTTRLCDTAVFPTEKYQRISGSSQFKPMLLPVILHLLNINKKFQPRRLGRLEREFN